MSIPEAHHFLPEFYLRRWANAQGEVIEFSRPYKKVAWKRRHPAATGYQPNLYAIESRKDPRARQEIELDVMAPLDFEASKALDELERTGEIEDPKLREAWARFIMSLMYRSPRRIEGLRAKVQSIDTSGLEERYSQVRSPSDPLTAKDYLAGVDVGFHNESAGLLLTNLVSASRDTINYTTNMQWRRIDLKQQLHSLVTCDDPILLHNGIGRPDGFIALPVGPDSVFLATNNIDVAQAFERSWRDRSATSRINHALCTNAWSLVIGDSRDHLRFVEKRLRWRHEKGDGLQRNTWRSPLG